MHYSIEAKTIADSDVVVIGGGPAGLGAAIAAARNGAKTLLVEQHGALGGMMTLGLVMPLAGQATFEGNLLGGILQEFLERVMAEGKNYCIGSEDDQKVKQGVSVAASAPSLYSQALSWHQSFFSSPHIMKHVALEMVLEAGVDILFHTSLVDVVRENNRITMVVVNTKSGIGTITGREFIDATGDGDVIYRAGEEFVKGSEPGVMSSLLETGLDTVHDEDADHSAYGEYEQSGLMQPVTIMFTMGNIDTERAKAFCNIKVRYSDIGITREDFLKLPYANTPGFVVDDTDEVPLPQGRVLFFRTLRQGEAVINMTRVIGIDGSDAADLSRGEILCQRQVFYVLDFLKRFIPGFEKSYLIETADVLGVRETRRLVGRKVLTGREAINCVPMPDVIANGTYIIDIHDPQGKRKAIGGTIHGECYDIPYGSLTPKTVENLLAAGRCISTDHVAHSSARVQGTCMLIGQAAGTAAAIAAAECKAVGDISIADLQHRLTDAGVKLRNAAKVN